jgi:hypothetical protein
MEKTNKIGWKQSNMMIPRGTRGIGLRQLLGIHCAGFANIWRGYIGYDRQN